MIDEMHMLIAIEQQRKVKKDPNSTRRANGINLCRQIHEHNANEKHKEKKKQVSSIGKKKIKEMRKTYRI